VTVYIKVPEIGNVGKMHGCAGCVAYEADERTCNKLAALSQQHDCRDIIWIEDTEAARLAYITLKLEN
jgi:hypothetical protein